MKRETVLMLLILAASFVQAASIECCLITSAVAARYDSLPQDKYEIVKRTEAQKALVQGPAGNNVEKKDGAVPQEMVFTHMDNTCYFLGDTLYYKVYVQRSDTGKPSNLSGVAYAELLNQDGYLVERQVLRLKEGQANSQFCLADTLYAGYYELRVYTRWQLNFGRQEHPHQRHMDRWFLKEEYAKEFFVDYDKLYSRVFPVYDKPEVPGEYYREMTTRPLRRDYKDDKIHRDALVSFFPEGGNLVAGLRQRVAFEACDDEGRHLDGRLALLGNVGDTLLCVGTENRGRGTFSHSFQMDDCYRVVFIDTTGYVTKVKLPKRTRNGVVMTVSQEAGNIHADIQTAGVSADSLNLAVSCRGISLMTFPVSQDGIDIDTSKLPSGIIQMSLTTAGGLVLADRLAFVRNDDMLRGEIHIDGTKQVCQPLAKCQLGVKGPAGSRLSLAIRDRMTSDPITDNGNIMTELLLCSQIKGFVEQPGYYFEADDPVHRRHLDLLLMVQGWRRFDDPGTTRNFYQVEPLEKSRSIVGDVNRYEPLQQEDGFMLTLESEGNPDLILYRGTCGPFVLPKAHDGSSIFTPKTGEFKSSPLWLADGFTVKSYDYEFLHDLKEEVPLHAEFVQPGFPPVYGDMKIRKDGSFVIQAPHFNGYCLMHLSTARPRDIVAIDSLQAVREKQQKKKIKDKQRDVEHYQWLLPDADEYPAYNVRVRQFYPRFPKPYTYYQTAFPILSPDEEENQSASAKNWQVGDVTDMKELKIGARKRILRKLDLSKPALVLDAYDAFNQITDAGLSCAFYAGSMTFSSNLARLLSGDMGILRGYDLERRWNGRNITVNSIQNESEQLKYNHLENLDKVYYYTDYAPREEGRSGYSASDQPSVTVDIHCFTDNTIRPTYRDRYITLDGYNLPAEFYHPDYSKHKLPEGQKDYRRTLYWNPNLQLDENGEARVTFYNNSRTTSLSVEAEGQAADGTLLWSR